MCNDEQGSKIKKYKYTKMFLWYLFLFSFFLPNVSILKEVQSAEIAYTTPFGPWTTIKNLVWTEMLNGDTGKAFVGLGDWDTATVQITGTFGVGGNLRIEASNNTGTPTWYNAKDITAAGIYVIYAGYYQIRPNVTTGDGTTNLTVTMVITHSTPDTKNLNDMIDVVIANPTNTQVLKYNSTTSKWENAAVNTATTVDISNTAPAITLTDTTALAKSLKIDVDADIAQIRELNGIANSLISMNLQRNSIGIGIIPGTFGEIFSIQKIASNPAVDIVPTGLNVSVQYAGAGALGFMYSTLQTINKTGAGDVTNMLGINCYSTANTGGGIITNLSLFNSDASVASGTTITRAQYFHVTPGSGTGTITSEVGFVCPTLTKGTNRAGFVYGLADQTLPSGVFGIYTSVDNIALCAVSGNVGIGVTSPSAVLNLKAGTAIAGTAPIKLTPGASMTTPEVGAVEFSGTDLFITDSTPTRHGIISHIVSATNPHGTTLTQTNLNLTGAFDISNTAPAITLTDTTALAKSLKIDVDGNVAQIREIAGVSGSLLSFNLVNNRVGIRTDNPLDALDCVGGGLFRNSAVGPVGARGMSISYDPATFTGILQSTWFGNQNDPMKIYAKTLTITPGFYSDQPPFFIGLTGNVGIGTSSPVISGTGKLHMGADTFRLDTARTPATSGAAGNTGEWCWDASFVYVCTATNTWKKVALTTW